MAKESDLVLALEFITRGARAEVPPALRTAVFALEDFQVEAEKLREKAHDWTTARGIQVKIELAALQ